MTYYKRKIQRETIIGNCHKRLNCIFHAVYSNLKLSSLFTWCSVITVMIYICAIYIRCICIYIYIYIYINISYIYIYIIHICISIYIYIYIYTPLIELCFCFDFTLPSTSFCFESFG